MGSKGQEAISQRPEKASFYLFQFIGLAVSLCLAHPQAPASPPYKREVGGVLLHTQKLHKSRWQDACGFGGRGVLELRPSYLNDFLPPLTTKWPSVEGPRECWWGNMGLY